MNAAGGEVRGRGRRGSASLAALIAGVGLAVALSSVVMSASAAPGADQFPDVTLRLADVFPSSDSYTLWLQRFAAKVARDTKNHLKITIYPNGELGTNSGAVTAVASGAVDMAVAAPQLEAPLQPGIDVQFLPGFVHTYAEALKIIHSPAVLGIKAHALAHSNLKPLSECFTGFLYIASKKPLSTVSAIQGLKFRVPDQGNAAIVSALGGVPSVIPLAEAYTALQLGTVDATPATVPTAAAQKYYQVAKYYDMTPLAANYEDVLINANSFKKLSAAEQKVLVNDGVSTQDDCSRSIQQTSTASLKQMVAGGATLVPAAKDYTPYSTAFASLLRKGETANPLAEQLTKAETKAIAAKTAAVKVSVVGKKVSLSGADNLAAGPAMFRVVDRSKSGGFVLTGPGVAKHTTNGFVGSVSWKLTLQPGRYVFTSAGRKRYFVVKP